MAEAGYSSRAMSDAAVDDVSLVLSGMVSFLQNANRPTAARWHARKKSVPRVFPGSSKLFGGFRRFLTQRMLSLVVVMAIHDCVSIELPQGSQSTHVCDL